MHTVNSAIELFRDSDEIGKLAASTRTRHKYVLDLLKKEAGPSTPVARLTRSDIDGVLADRRTEGCSERTINSYKSTLRMFAAWLLETGLHKRNVAAHLRNGKSAPTSSAKKRPITPDKIRDMFKLAAERHPRDCVTLMLLVYTGCRGSEVTGLRWRDVDLNAGTISVYRPKTLDYHHVTMPDQLAAELSSWKKMTEQDYGVTVKPSHFVVPALRHRGFPGGAPAKMDPSWPLNPERKQVDVRKMCKLMMRSVGETDLFGRGAHTMRRSAANMLLEQTNDIRIVQSFLGHTSVRVTEMYLDQDAQASRSRAAIKNWSI